MKGGIVCDVSGLAKPERVRLIVKKIRQYVETMHRQCRPITNIAVSKSDYSAMVSACKKTIVGDSEIIGIEFIGTKITS